MQGEDIKGIYHWSGEENMTKYNMAMAMATAFGLPTEHILADRSPSGGATRPYDAHLDCTKVSNLGIGQQSLFKKSIKLILDKFYP